MNTFILIFADNGANLYRIRYVNFAVTGENDPRCQEEAKLHQGELARRLGMSRATLSRSKTVTIEEFGIRNLPNFVTGCAPKLFRPPRTPTDIAGGVLTEPP